MGRWSDTWYFTALWSLIVAKGGDISKAMTPTAIPNSGLGASNSRSAPLALYLHTLVILWFAEHGRFDVEACRRAHPWYRAKRTPSFADMLVCFKMASLRESISRYPGQKPPSAKKLLPLFQALEAAA